ncbi:arginine deiminase [Candidatus Saccharibacteria bacterium]|nr:arginine deiminase [Candidatus Saccharibacteria bacterium]
MDSPLYIKSEIGKLKTVLLHRPGKEVENLTPDYLADLLFDDIPYLEVAQKEHDAFAKVLEDNGTEVLYVDKLAAEALKDPEVQSKFIYDILRNSKQGDRNVTKTLYSYLQSMKTIDMVHTIMAGVRKDELNVGYDGAKRLHEMLGDTYPFYLDPMPNLYFTRDPAAVIGTGLSINKMHFPARRRESLFIKYIIEHHPRFAGVNVPIWYSRDSKFSIEGGDQLVLSKDTVAIGISQRTSAEAIETIAEKLLTDGGFSQIVAIEIPKSRAFMHLDTVFTMVDYDKFTVHPAIQDNNGKMNIFILTRNFTSGGLHIARRSNLTETLCEVLGKNKITLIPCGGGDPIASAREQWNDGSNTLAIAPGVVVTYDRNYVSNALMHKHGLEVIEVTGAELVRGRGGPRCMSMPMVREDI